MISGHTFSSSLLKMDWTRLSKVGASPDDECPVFIGRFDSFLYFLFDAIHFPCRQKLTVRKGFKSIVIATDAHKSLHMAIPRCNIFISNRPIHRKTIPPWPFKIVLTPTLRLASPDQGFSSHLVAPDPIKWLGLDIRMLRIFDKKMFSIFLVGIASVDNWIF